MAQGILVTGASGWLGSAIVEALLARGDAVTGLDTGGHEPAGERGHVVQELARAHVDEAGRRAAGEEWIFRFASHGGVQDVDERADGLGLLGHGGHPTQPT